MAKPKDLSRLVAKDKARARRREEDLLTKAKYRHLLKEIERVEAEKKAILEIKDGIQPTQIAAKVNGKSQAAPVFVWSDWHVDEGVRNAETNGLNKFNPEIAKERVENVARNSLRLLEIVKRDSVIEGAVLALLGDYITSNIHEEFLTTAKMHPIEAAIFAQNLIASGIELLLEKTDIHYTVVCKVGNHSRITQGQYHAREAEHSLEWFMYHNLKNYFRNSDRLTWVIDSAYHTYLPVLGRMIRFHHGHWMNFWGGVGGLTIPVNKAIDKWNRNLPRERIPEIDVFAHWHQFFDGGTFVCNGSLIGYNAYAISIKASYEPPRQSMFLIDRDHGKTIVAPIWVTKGR